MKLSFVVSAMGCVLLKLAKTIYKQLTLKKLLSPRTIFTVVISTISASAVIYTIQANQDCNEEEVALALQTSVPMWSWNNDTVNMEQLEVMEKTFPILMQTQEIQDFIDEVSMKDYQCSPTTIWGGSYGDVSPNSGAKLVCLSNRLRIDPNSCIVYSFGINDDWSYDVHARKFGCEVFSFDGKLDIKSTQFMKKIYYYDIVLHSKDFNTRTTKYKTFKSIQNQLGHEHLLLDVVKLDIGKLEWEILPSLLKSGKLDFIKQLHVEFHWDRKMEPEKHLDVIKQLRKYGMLIFDTQWKVCYPICSNSPCVLISLVNRKHLKAN